MPTDLQRMLTKDLANTAALMLDALRNAPDRAETTVNTELCEATVLVDDNGADVIVHDRDVTVHVRQTASGKNEN